MARLCGCVSLSELLTTRQPQTLSHAVFLPRSLCSARASAAHSCRSAHQVSLYFLVDGGINDNQIPLLFWLSPAMSSQLLCCILALSVPLPFHLPLLLHLPTFRCFSVQISQVHLYVEQGIFC